MKNLTRILQALGDTLGDVPLPHVVLRRPGGRRGSAIVWSGALSDAKPSLWTSPARDELVRRLAKGDSVVWLVFAGKDQAGSQKVVEQLQKQLPELADEIPLPAGVGLPGSELLTRLPLEVRFSVLIVDVKSAEEAMLRNLVTRGVIEDVADDEAIVVPVFGRGRAMTALKADSIDEALLAECAGFLCGACSCQVKQSNPGFDLLLAVNWGERLWEDPDLLPETTEPEPAGEAGDAFDQPVPDEPVYVPIPTGREETPAGREEPAADRKEPAASEPSATVPQATSEPQVESQPDHVLRWAALGIAALVIGLVLGFRRSA